MSIRHSWCYSYGLAWTASKSSLLSATVAVLHSYDNFSLGTFRHVADSVSFFGQRVAAIDDGHDLAFFHKLFDEEQIGSLGAVGQLYHLLAAQHGNEGSPD